MHLFPRSAYTPFLCIAELVGLLLSYAQVPQAEPQACNSRNNLRYLHWQEVVFRKNTHAQAFVHKV